MPVEWLATFSKNREWRWAINRRRLVVRHPDGFNVLDAARRGGAVKAQLKNELEIYQNNFSRIVRAATEKRPPVRSQSRLGNLSEYLRQRLLQALNVRTAAALNRMLFERRARVSVSATHLEITFALADLSFEVRFAGIDRDPGWIPAAGKYVYFHYV